MASSVIWQKKPTWCKPFPVIGKGTFLFNAERNRPFRIVVRDVLPDSKTDASTIDLTVGNDAALFICRVDSKTFPIPATRPHPFFGDNIGIEKDLFCTYWLSYDSDRMVVKYGKGYRMNKTTIISHDFSKNAKNKEEREATRAALFDPKVQRNVEFYDETIKVSSMVDLEPKVDFDHLPFVSDRPYIVIDSSMVNMFDLDEGLFTYSASLPKECLELYTNVTAKNVNLEFMKGKPCPGFYLVDAIRNSIRTPDAHLNTILKEKVDQFGDKNETYLRITLGDGLGNSPGIPYVLEIWPSGHGSPVHNHGNAYAVIRVLHGGLTVNVYNKTSVGKNQSSTTCDDNGFLFNFDVKRDDVTWISPNWYQTHRLWNSTDDFCATIQCYQYGENDNTHWPYFDYVASCDYMDVFEPDSDLTFTEMVAKLKEEYLNGVWK